MKDANGKSLFAISDAELKAGGRKDAANDDTKFFSKEGEWFLAGVLEGLPDGKPTSKSHKRCPTRRVKSF